MNRCGLGLSAFAVFAITGLNACGDDDPPDSDGSSLRTLRVRIENISDRSQLPTPFAPGVWAAHTLANPLFTNAAPEAGNGLEALAEDGTPDALFAALDSDLNGAVFNTPVGASGPDAIGPGGAYEFSFEIDPDEETRLSFATMLVQSNDYFLAADALPLVQNGTLLTGDITAQLAIWDAGTETDQALGLGPDQAPRQNAMDPGAAEGVVREFTDTTRALPLASQLVSIDVTEDGGTFTVVVNNISDQTGTFVTPIAPVFWALHGSDWTLFEEGAADSGQGLESLAEDGSPANLVASYSGNPDLIVGAMAQPVGESADGPAGPGGSYRFEVTPDADHPYLTLASMAVETNDVFLAFSPEGVALMSDGAVRPAAEVAEEVNRRLALWDAGTELNEVPGVGPHQAPRQLPTELGDADPDATVRRYQDSTNDLAATTIADFFSVSVIDGPTEGSFEVTLTNTSDATPFPVAFAPVNVTVHAPEAALFQIGAAASSGLEQLAEDGSPVALGQELAGATGVSSSDAVDTPVGGSAPGAITAGQSFAFTATATTTHRYLNFATMVVPSNDTFLALPPEGVALLEADGSARPAAMVRDEIEAALVAWDAGTEANQAGAAGADQAPQQSGPDTGAGEGSGTVRPADDIWGLPSVTDLVRVTVSEL